MPILAICRGTQALNVVRGGTLVQHLPDRPTGRTAIPHRQRTPGSEPSHAVGIEPGSLLAATIGSDEADVNSFHHQAIDRLGRDLVAIAWAAGRRRSRPSRTRAGAFLIGVQWHAELLIDRPERAGAVRRLRRRPRLVQGPRSAGRTT